MEVRVIAGKVVVKKQNQDVGTTASVIHGGKVAL